MNIIDFNEKTLSIENKKGICYQISFNELGYIEVFNIDKEKTIFKEYF